MSIYVTSRSDPGDLAAEYGSYHLWAKRLWPYLELAPGATLYWYESSAHEIQYRSKVKDVLQFEYGDGPDKALRRVEKSFKCTFYRDHPYLENRPYEGYCLAYTVHKVKRVHLPKPVDMKRRFSQTGWERGDNPDIAKWLP